MAETSTPASSSTGPNDEKFSIWATLLNLASFKTDSKRWNDQWESALDILTSQEVYLRMGGLFDGDVENIDLTIVDTISFLNRDICRNQGLLLHVWGKADLKQHLVTTWLLLDRTDHTRHLMKGFEDTFEKIPLHQDLRALCPEIKTSLLVAHRGRSFVDFVDTYVAGKNAIVDPTVPYLLPSTWWDKAADDVPLSELEAVESDVLLLTLFRNEFIVLFILNSVMSLFHDLTFGDTAMNPVREMMQEQPMFARALSKVHYTRLGKPLVRCENCTKTPEQIGHNARFMVCSACKTKLQFKIHYCSADCQKQDWPLHKKHCGKQRVSKKLKGTVHDPAWEFLDAPDHLRLASTPGSNIPIGETGFGTPSAAATYSPALRRQVALLRADREADYFLFDAHDRPIRFVAPAGLLKMAFRILRSDALGPREQLGLEGISEYMVKVMGPQPGLGRERIFAQLQSEYGCDVAMGVRFFARASAAQGDPGRTFLENMSANLAAVPEISQFLPSAQRGH